MKSLREIYHPLSKETDKGTTHNFIDLYEALLRHYRHTATRLLEIGVWSGGSLRMWDTYFDNEEFNLVGVDKGFDTQWGPAPLPKPWDENIRIIKADSTDPKLYSQLYRDGKFDIIIDDGSHILEDQIATYRILFPLLKPGGMYVIEDFGSIIEGIKQMSFESCCTVIKEVIPDCIIIDVRASKGKYNDVLVVTYAIEETNENN